MWGHTCAVRAHSAWCSCAHRLVFVRAHAQSCVLRYTHAPPGLYCARGSSKVGDEAVGEAWGGVSRLDVDSRPHSRPPTATQWGGCDFSAVNETAKT